MLPNASTPKRLLELAYSHAKALPIATSVLACRKLIAWRNWEETGLAPALASRLHTAELIGPDCHIGDDRVRVGLLLSNHATDDPISRHAGEETYLVISGVAEWSVDGSDYQSHDPGTLVHHPA